MDPTFSIVLPCWNSVDFIDRCIESLKNQTYKNFEVIIIDNSSKDGTFEKVKKIKDERFRVFNINNEGILAKSRNLGINKSKGEWIAFLDSDDWWTKDKLQICYENINNKVDFLYHDLEIKSENPRILKRKKNKSYQLRKPVLINLLTEGNLISNSSAVVRKQLLLKIGGIDENNELPAAEDYNAWLRIAKITDQFLYLPYVLGYYFVHDQGMSHKDMSIPGRHAVSEFLGILNRKQKLIMECNFKYQSARYNYLQSDFEKSKENLFFILRNGKFSLKIKAIIMIIMMIVR